MVKKKGKSKRTTLKDKYKIQKRTAEHHRKLRRQAKRDAAAGKVKHKVKVSCSYVTCFALAFPV